MADLCVNKTDLLYYLTGEKIVSTYAVVTTMDKRYLNGDLIIVEDNAFTIYTRENGVVGTMHVGRT